MVETQHSAGDGVTVILRRAFKGQCPIWLLPRDPLAINAVMIERNRKNEDSTRSKHTHDFAQSALVIRHMFQHIHASHSVKRRVRKVQCSQVTQS